MKGHKADEAKLDWTLVPWSALAPIVKVLEFGAKKYGRDNWQHVEPAERRYTAAAYRHLNAFTEGEDTDPESGQLHLAHLGCCVLFLLWHVLQRKKIKFNNLDK
jgi:hypothetical protein